MAGIERARQGIGLIVVDVQRVFTSPKSPLADRGVDLSQMEATVPSVRELLAAVRSSGMPIFFIRAVRRDDGSDAPQNVYDILPAVYQSGEPICCAGQMTTDYVEGIGPLEGEYEVHKRRYNAFNGTSLDYYLRAENVDTVLVCGFASNVCVESTVRGAHERGYNAIVVEDCCASFSKAMHESAMANIDLFFGTTMPFDSVRREFLTGSIEL